MGKDHPGLVQLYSNIGYVYIKLKDYANALEYFKKSLAVKEKILGDDHPSTKETKETIERLKQKLNQKEK